MKKLMIVPIVALGMLFTTNVNAQIKDENNSKKAEMSTQDKYAKINKSELPAAVTASVERDFKGSTVAEAYKAKDNTYKLVLVNENGERGMVFADPNGKWIKPSK